MAPPAIHCMQGRLLPPEPGRFQAFPPERWRDELELAPSAGVEGIEWIYEEHGRDRNPLGSDEGLAALDEVRARMGVVVESLCADWFMDRPLLADVADGVERLRWLCGRAAAAGISRIVMPFVDASDLRGPDDVDALVAALDGFDASRGVEIHLETSLDPSAFAALLSRLPDPPFKANYDTGNSASLGYDPEEELAAYGSRIGSVHVKDRVRGGGTVPLGEGDASIETVFELLQRLGWDRPLVLQAARGPDGHEVETVARQAELVRSMWSRSRAAA
ncbi:MAG: sugar phosphate isomerase/epimerase family protein [Thermoleophilaceae bacterium]